MVLSPAKTLDCFSKNKLEKYTEPLLLDRSEQLVNQLRFFSPRDLGQLMGISDKLAQLNVARFQEWSRFCSRDVAKQSVLAFKGDVYTGLDAESLDEEGLDYLQKHLRILSGLYGVLRPLDLMRPYRLEMGTRLQCEDNKNLYEFWGRLITDQLNKQLKSIKSKVLVNLASNEYFKSVKTQLLEVEVITPIFQDLKNGQYKVISFYAKKARGMMVRYATDHKIKNYTKLKQFDYGGYCYNRELSSDVNWVFTRDDN